MAKRNRFLKKLRGKTGFNIEDLDIVLKAIKTVMLEDLYHTGKASMPDVVDWKHSRRKAQTGRYIPATGKRISIPETITISAKVPKATKEDYRALKPKK